LNSACQNNPKKRLFGILYKFQDTCFREGKKAREGTVQRGRKSARGQLSVRLW